MGRSSRKKGWTDQHPDRKHWTPHQRALAGMMTEEAYNGLYGRVSDTSSWSSPLFRRPLSPLDLQQIQSLENLQDFIDKNFLPGTVSESDPVLRALWKSEWERTDRLLEEIGCAPLARESYGAWLGSVGHWPDGPCSVLLAGLDEGKELSLARALENFREKDPRRAREIFEKEFLPEMTELLARPLHSELARQLWELAAESQSSDPMLNLQKHADALAELTGGQPATILPEGTHWQERHGRRPSLWQEALLETNWSLLRQGAMYRAAEQVFRRQVDGIFHGIGGSGAETRAAWKERYLKLRAGREPGASPLENFRVLFSAEGKDDELGRLIEIVDIELAGASSPNGAGALREKIAGNSFLRDGIFGSSRLSDLIAGTVIEAINDGSIGR